MPRRCPSGNSKLVTVDLTEHEAKEVILALRYLFDATLDHLPMGEQVSHVYVSVISKLQVSLGMNGISPWDKPESFE